MNTNALSAETAIKNNINSYHDYLHCHYYCYIYYLYILQRNALKVDGKCISSTYLLYDTMLLQLLDVIVQIILVL